MTFGERVLQLRLERSWSLRDLAAKVDVGFTYLSRVENERLSKQSLKSLAKSSFAIRANPKQSTSGRSMPRACRSGFEKKAVATCTIGMKRIWGGWLCPALFKYFDQTPEKLYIQVKAAEGQC